VRLLKTKLRTPVTQNNLESLMLIAVEKTLQWKSNRTKQNYW